MVLSRLAVATGLIREPRAAVSGGRPGFAVLKRIGL